MEKQNNVTAEQITEALTSSASATIEAMKSVASTMFGYYNFTFGYEPTVKNLYHLY